MKKQNFTDMLLSVVPAANGPFARCTHCGPGRVSVHQLQVMGAWPRTGRRPQSRRSPSPNASEAVHDFLLASELVGILMKVA